ncbi:hypothetical protein [Streptomyces sp. TRM64462]|uniref:hypothetical protein n=1 Tax=Streptomyces sp. TRM64462 TaxID=2741726 RepID=UPI001C2F2336|nr:hypothetical protein [Streptomyces sp. TRM64462]
MRLTRGVAVELGKRYYDDGFGPTAWYPRSRTACHSEKCGAHEQLGGEEAAIVTTESVNKYCIVCDRVITGEYEVIEGFSASGARPDAYRHPMCGPRPVPFVRRDPVDPYGAH